MSVCARCDRVHLTDQLTKNPGIGILGLSRCVSVSLCPRCFRTALWLSHEMRGHVTQERGPFSQMPSGLCLLPELLLPDTAVKSAGHDA